MESAQPILKEQPAQDQPSAPIQSTNPGTYEEIHRKCRDIFPICFEGAKAMAMKPITSHFQVFRK
jgi:mitochondrial import receptor subunit TOM40